MSLIKENIALAYQIIAHLNLSDHTYTHLSARSENRSSFYIYPFGMIFEEVLPENLIEVSLDGKILQGSEYQYNQTGYVIHGNIYKTRDDINCIFHLHTADIVAISALKAGLKPISQWALHFYNQIVYHDYNSLTLHDELGADLVSDLQDKYIMLLRNHGSITAGRTIEEAMFYTYHLQKACEVQCRLISVQDSLLVFPSEDVCNKTVHDVLNFEKNLGERDWQAWRRIIQSKLPPKTF